MSSSTASEIAQYFDAKSAPEAALEPSWNVAPTNDVYVVLEDASTRVVAPHSWGLVPIWAKSPALGNKMINARADGIATKNAYRHAFKNRRCIVPVDGFYEWHKVEGQKAKQPYFITRRDGEPLAFAGLWEEWRGPDRDGSERLRSTTIITTDPNDLIATIHHRMPVILPPSVWDEWLDEDQHDTEALARLLVPAPSELLVLRPVSNEVNNVRNKGEHLIDRVEPAPGAPDPTP